MTIGTTTLWGGKRLEQKCPDLRMLPKCRGQFRLEVDCAPQLVEKDSA